MKNTKKSISNYFRIGLRALQDGRFDLAKTCFSMCYKIKQEAYFLCLLLLCDVFVINPKFAKLIIKDLIKNKKNAENAYCEYLADFLLTYPNSKQNINELDCINYSDFLSVLNKSKNKKEHIINMINSTRIIISSKHELADFLNELIKAKLYAIALVYCEQTYMHFMGDEYFAKIVSMLMEKMKNASKN